MIAAIESSWTGKARSRRCPDRAAPSRGGHGTCMGNSALGVFLAPWASKTGPPYPPGCGGLFWLPGVGGAGLSLPSGVRDSGVPLYYFKLVDSIMVADHGVHELADDAEAHLGRPDQRRKLLQNLLLPLLKSDGPLRAFESSDSAGRRCDGPYGRVLGPNRNAATHSKRLSQCRNARCRNRRLRSCTEFQEWEG